MWMTSRSSLRRQNGCGSDGGWKRPCREGKGSWAMSKGYLVGPRVAWDQKTCRGGVAARNAS